MPERATNKTVSHKTVLNVIGTLSSILTTARNWRYNCEQIHVSKLRLPTRGTSYEAPHFSVEQVQQILAIAKEPWRTMFCLFHDGWIACRRSAGASMARHRSRARLLHIRRSAWYGRVQTAKSWESETTLPIPETLAAVLANYRSQWKPNPHGFLFATRNDRPPSSNKVVEYRLWPILDALGIPRCGLHAFPPHPHGALAGFWSHTESCATTASSCRCQDNTPDLWTHCR